jgi:hypothetical protein
VGRSLEPIEQAAREADTPARVPPIVMRIPACDSGARQEPLLARMCPRWWATAGRVRRVEDNWPNRILPVTATPPSCLRASAVGERTLRLHPPVIPVWRWRYLHARVLIRRRNARTEFVVAVADQESRVATIRAPADCA